ncbi:MAG: hypothetical protein PSX81_06520 [bacterium]|nr:hypothetical protein [bacterium]
MKNILLIFLLFHTGRIFGEHGGIPVSCAEIGLYQKSNPVGIKCNLYLQPFFQSEYILSYKPCLTK